MATEVRWRRGTTAQHATFVGAPAEVTVDTDKKTLVVHDGVTPGGFPLVNENDTLKFVETISSLRNTPLSFDRVYVKAHSSEGDGGHGIFRVVSGVPAGTYTDNNGTVIVPTGGDGSSAWIREYSGFVNVKWFGAKADWNGSVGTDNSLAFDRCISFAKSKEASVLIPEGDYYIGNLPDQNGRIFLIGSGNSKLVGKFRYSGQVFPASADTTIPLTNSDPYFFVDGVDFESIGNTFSLEIDLPHNSAFYEVGLIKNCKFFGQNGLFLREVTTTTFQNLRFYNTGIGVEAQATTNCNWIDCRWHNQAGYGIKLVPNTNGSPTRLAAGENARFTNCEWAVCNHGIYSVGHGWLLIDNCLLDYCTLPIYVEGTYHESPLRCKNTYIAVSGHAKNNLVSLPGYVAPLYEGLAVYIKYSSTLDYKVAAHFDGCQFVNYNIFVPSNVFNPPVYINGVIEDGVERVEFSNCDFASAKSDLKYLLDVSFFRSASISECTFQCYSPTSTLIDAYNLYNGKEIYAKGNDTTNLLNNGIRVFPSKDEPKVISGSTVVSLDGNGIGTVTFSGIKKNIISIVASNGDYNVHPSSPVSTMFSGELNTFYVKFNGVANENVRVNWIVTGT